MQSYAEYAEQGWLWSVVTSTAPVTLWSAEFCLQSFLVAWAAGRAPGCFPQSHVRSQVPSKSCVQELECKHPCHMDSISPQISGQG